MSATPSYRETTSDTFDQDVFEASLDKIVIVDFYADWCQPCRMLDPILKEVVAEIPEKFSLVKANTEILQNHAEAFSVSSIPVLFAISKKSVIDRVEGLLTKADLQQWLQGLLIGKSLQEASEKEESNPIEAISIYEKLLAENPRASEIKLALMRAQYKAGWFDKVEEQLSELEKRGFLEPEAQRIKSQLNLAKAGSADPAELKQKISYNPKDFDARIKLARLYAQMTEYESALATALEVVQLDRSQFRKEAQELMLDIFRVLPTDSELLGEYRRKLASALW
ncbi:MAG: Thioredoxin [Planctomycetota bacterium]